MNAAMIREEFEEWFAGFGEHIFADTKHVAFMAWQAAASHAGGDVARLDAMIKHEWRMGWTREEDFCRVWAVIDEEEGTEAPVCGWETFFDDPRNAIDAAIRAGGEAG